MEDCELLFDGTELRLLSGPAALIWDRVDGCATVGAIASDIAAGFGNERSAEVRADVLRFLAELVMAGALELDSARQRAPDYLRPPHVGYAEDGAHTVLVNMIDGRRQALEASGRRIWHLVCSGAGTAEVIDVMRTDFPDAPESLETEVAGFLEELVQSGFLTIGLRLPDAGDLAD